MSDRWKSEDGPPVFCSECRRQLTGIGEICCYVKMTEDQREPTEKELDQWDEEVREHRDRRNKEKWDRFFQD